MADYQQNATMRSLADSPISSSANIPYPNTQNRRLYCIRDDGNPEVTN
ncbi:MAG: hypothetical protein F6J87_04365 [Spirulina sp. SIO3F2]|nr:hypothetical protein [Spirulina sp. SIO3F2]